jgi:hypothetical protein
MNQAPTLEIKGLCCGYFVYSQKISSTALQFFIEPHLSERIREKKRFL